MIAANVFAAETDAEGARLRTSMQQAFAQLRSGRPGKLPRPVDDIAALLDRATLAGVDHALAVSATGARATVRDQLGEIVGRWRPDELIVTGQIHDHAARLRSFEIAAEAMGWQTGLPGARIPETAGRDLRRRRIAARPRPRRSAESRATRGAK
jgi:alkanesulfonate monooxygenase SsuD/methylene tetrahydromethanopterin reductase-like flavin-dependent oxidoreductase (luciferase family)